MQEKLFCLNLNRGVDIPYEQQLEMMKAAGFGGFFPLWTPELDVDGLAAKARQLGMYFQSIHAPWKRVADMWHGDPEKAQAGVEELKACVDACKRSGTGLLIVHPFIGFQEHDPQPIGLERFSQVVDYAACKDIKIAFENVEGEEYLKALMDHFADASHVGFCWDTGHELCYNHSIDQLALYGDRLLGTHLNDNLGCIGQEITPKDDLHLLPFDGIADWQGIVSRLHRHHFTGCLTFELKYISRRSCPETDRYLTLSFEAYLAQAYQRACRVWELLQNVKQG